MSFNSRTFFFYFLNATRVLSIVGLLLVLSSNILVLVQDVIAVHRFLQEGGNTAAAQSQPNSTLAQTEECHYIFNSTVPNQPVGAEMTVVNQLLIVVQCAILILSELGWPMKLFDMYLPVLGSTFGLGALGVFQVLIGASVLSHHLDTFPRVAAFFLFSVGWLNILLGLIFREDAKRRRSLASKNREATDEFITPRPSTTTVPPSYAAHSREASFQHNSNLEKTDFGPTLLGLKLESKPQLPAPTKEVPGFVGVSHSRASSRTAFTHSYSNSFEKQSDKLRYSNTEPAHLPVANEHGLTKEED